MFKVSIEKMQSNHPNHPNHPNQSSQQDQSTLEDCPICITPLSEPITVTTCKHAYHSECLHKWILVNNTCPLCQNEITIECKNLSDMCDACYIHSKKAIIHVQKREFLPFFVEVYMLINLSFKIMNIRMDDIDLERYQIAQRLMIVVLACKTYIIFSLREGITFQSLQYLFGIMYLLVNLRFECNTYVMYVQMYIMHLMYFWGIVLFSRFSEHSMIEIAVVYMHIILTVRLTCMLFSSKNTIVILKKIIEYL